MTDRPPPPPRSRLRRAAPFFLIAGAIAAGAAFVQKMPHERVVELRIEDPASVRRVEIAWRLGAGDPVQGSSWSFDDAKPAPPALEMKLNLPDGRYDVDVLVERVGGSHDARKSVELGESDRIAIPVK